MNSNSQKTQRKNTAATYKKLLPMVQGVILDYGAGLLEGTKVFQDNLFNAEAYEPFPRDDIHPDYTSVDQINRKFDTIVCNCVLNVIDSEKERREIVLSIWNLLEDGGNAFIMVRSVANVEAYIKTATTVGAHEYRFPNGVFQKGFTLAELHRTIYDALCRDNHETVFEEIRGINPLGFKITKIS